MTHVERMVLIVKLKLKFQMLRSGLCGDSDAYTHIYIYICIYNIYIYIYVYIYVSETITVAQLAAGRGNNKIQVVLEASAQFTDRIYEINNMQIDNAKDIDAFIPI